MEKTKNKRKKPVVDFKMIRGYVRSIRVHQKLSLKDMSERTGYSSQFISAVERGEVDLDITLLFTFLDALGYELILRKKQIAPAKNSGENSNG
jgi:transcriptional regulator with XRE-family HTH domain